MAVTISTITTLEKLSLINSNFTKLATAINSNLVWKTGSVSGEATLVRDLDINGHTILNAYVGGHSLTEAVGLVYDNFDSIQSAIEAAGVAVASAASAAASAQLAQEAAESVGDAVEIVENLASPQGGSYIGMLKGSTLDKYVTHITPEQFGAVGNGVADDTGAVQQAFNYLVANPNTQIVGNGNYAVSSTIYMFNYGFAMRAYLRRITVLNTFPAPVSWKVATPIFMAGYPSSTGAMVGLNLTVDYIDGNARADILHVAYYGCGGSHFHFERVVNMVNGVVTPNNLFPASSNTITGGYWNNFVGQAFRIGKLPEYSNVWTNEAWVIDVNFITGCNRGAYHIRTGAMYANIRGQSDFNGYYLEKLYFTSDIGARSGSTITWNGNTYEVICYSQKYSADNAILIDCKQDVSSGPLIAAGQTITFNGNNYTVGATDYPTNNNYYPDIIHDFYDSAGIAKCLIQSPYCGGIEGTLMFSSDIHIGNSGEGFINQLAGISWVHSGSIATIRNHYNQVEIISSTANYVYPGTHMLMRRYRVYGTEYYTAPASGVATTVATMTKWGDGTVSVAREVYTATYTSPTAGLYGQYLIYVGDSGVEVYKVAGDNIVTVSASGMDVVQTQSSGVTPVILWTFLRSL